MEALFSFLSDILSYASAGRRPRTKTGRLIGGIVFFVLIASIIALIFIIYRP